MQVMIHDSVNEQIDSFWEDPTKQKDRFRRRIGSDLGHFEAQFMD